MTLTELKYIVAVARERHFGRAAESCFVSQPTLSVAIRKLEDELGVTLFERSSGEVAVTQVGERVVRQAQRVLDDAEGVKEIALQGRDPLNGPLQLGIIFTIGPYLLPQLIRKLQKSAPSMPVLIQENYTARLLEQLSEGVLDVVICALPINEPGVFVQALYDEPFVVAVPRGHPWAKRKAIKGEDLSHDNLLLLGSGHCFRDHVLNAFPALHRASRTTPGQMQKVLEGTSLETIRLMVASGAGITVLPSTAAAANRRDDMLTYLPFSKPKPDRRVMLVWRKSFTRPQAVEALRQAVLACALSEVQKLDQPAYASEDGPVEA